MTRSIACTTAVLALALAGPVAAQTSGQSGQQDQMTGAQGRMADQTTCADIATMDTAVVPGTLYFIAGYQEGRGMGMNEDDADISGVTGTAATTGATEQAADSATGQSAGTDGTDQAATTGQGGADASGTDPGGATGLAGTGTGTTDSGSASQNDSGMGTAQVAAISGFFEIPIEQVMRVCADAPERAVSDVMREQSGQGGSSDGSN